MKTKFSHGVMLLRNLDGAALCALTCCEHHLCWFVKQKDAFFPGSRPQCVFVQQSMEECVYHCEPPSDKRYHTHSGPFPVLYVTAAGHDEKPSCENGLFINFPGRHLISPPLEAVGGKKKYWISQHFTGSPCCCHGCWKLPQDMRMENRLWSAGRVSLLLGYCLISSSVRRCEQVFHQFSASWTAMWELLLPQDGLICSRETYSLLPHWEEANWFSGTIYTQPGC